MRGRKPTPLEMRIVRNNPGRRKLPEPLPEPAGGAVVELEEPASLVEAAAAEAKFNGPVLQPHSSIAAGEALEAWRRRTAQLAARRMLTAEDHANLLLYAVAFGEWAHAQRQIELTGRVLKTPNNYPVPSPWLPIRNKAADDIRKFEAEFGGSPSARTRIAVKIGGAGGANRTPRIQKFMERRLKRAK